MKNKLKILAIVFAVIALVVAVAPSPAARAASSDRQYAFTTLDVPGAKQTFPMGTNARGDIVGYYADSANVSHGFLLRDGKFTTLDYPGSNTAITQPSAIGANGDIVGDYSLSSPAPAGNWHGFLLTSKGEWSTVDYPERGRGHLMEGGAFALLPDGTMVGCVHDGVGSSVTAMYGYVMGPNGASRFDYPTAQPYSMFYDATSDGKTLVGAYTTIVEGAISPANGHGLFVDNGKAVSFDVPGKRGTTAQGINAARDVVGTYRVLVGSAWANHGYLAETRGSTNPADWQFTMVDAPGSSQTIVRGVNGAGDLLGYYIDSAGKTHGFTATQGARSSVSPAPAAASAPAPGIRPPSTGDGGLVGSTPAGPFWAQAVALVAVSTATLLFVRRRVVSR